jgi:DNA-binding GntR family transcriptional regulator
MGLDSLPRVSRDSRRQALVRVLTDAMVSGALKPGERLVEREVAARTGVSRGPVREALRELEQAGLIVTVPYQGSYVAGISDAEVDGIVIPIRLVLETFAWQQSASTLDEADFAYLADLVSQMQRAADAGDLPALVEIDLQFHSRVIERAGNQCFQIWRTIEPRVRAYFVRDVLRHPSLQDLPLEHVELLEAMRSDDVGRILPILDQHIREGSFLHGPAPETTEAGTREPASVSGEPAPVAASSR